MRVFGIDPGTGRMGWAIVEGNRSKQVLVACGCVETFRLEDGRKKKEERIEYDSSRRLVELHHGLEQIIEEFRPEVAAVEDLFFFKNAKTVISVAEARGMVVTLCGLKGMEVYDYTPLQVKQTITGYGRADKQQVELMVKAMLKIRGTIKPDDAADAVAVGLTHLIFNQQLR
jgi:crossover junction endodeoxyribonuclease RuvC